MSKPRLYSKRKYKAPKPRSRGNGKFELRVISEADSRYHVVKVLRQQVAKLIADTNADTRQKELLCARAAFIAAYLESQETESLEGKELDWKTYLAAVRSLADVLNKLGLNQAKAGTQTLQDYLTDNRPRHSGKRRRA